MKYQSNHVKSWHQYENVRSTPRRPFFQGRSSVESKHPWSRDFWGEQNPWISWISPLERGAGVGLSQALRVLPEAFSAQGIKYVGSWGKAQNLGKYVDTHMGKLWIYDIMIYIYTHMGYWKIMCFKRLLFFSEWLKGGFWKGHGNIVWWIVVRLSLYECHMWAYLIRWCI